MKAASTKSEIRRPRWTRPELINTPVDGLPAAAYRPGAAVSRCTADCSDVPASDIAFRPAVNYYEIVSPISRSGRKAAGLAATGSLDNRSRIQGEDCHATHCRFRTDPGADRCRRRAAGKRRQLSVAAHSHDHR